jgi:hypothetical protein
MSLGCSNIFGNKLFLHVVPSRYLLICLFRHHSMKMYEEVEVQLDVVLILAVDEDEWPALCLHPHYTQGGSPQDPSDRRLGGPQSQCGHGEEEKISSFARNQTPVINL